MDNKTLADLANTAKRVEDATQLRHMAPYKTITSFAVSSSVYSKLALTTVVDSC